MFNLFDMFAEMYRRFCTWDYINTGGYQFWSKTNPYYLAGQSFSRSTRDALHFPNFLIPLFYSSTFSTLQKNPSHPPTCLPFQQALERIPFWFSFWLTLLTQKINPIGSICGIYLPIFFTNKKLNHSHLSKYNIPSIHSSSPKMNEFVRSRNSSCVVPSLIAIGVSQIPKFWVSWHQDHAILQSWSYHLQSLHCDKLFVNFQSINYRWTRWARLVGYMEKMGLFWGKKTFFVFKILYINREHFKEWNHMKPMELSILNVRLKASTSNTSYCNGLGEGTAGVCLRDELGTWISWKPVVFCVWGG